MPQVKLLNATECDKGIKITYETLEKEIKTGIYTNRNLSVEDLNKMTGQQISFSENENKINVHKAWDGETPTFCDDPIHGIDR